jgi:aminoglycoside phosphotransferase (APT) family kinase protein
LAGKLRIADLMARWFRHSERSDYLVSHHAAGINLLKRIAEITNLPDEALSSLSDNIESDKSFEYVEKNLNDLYRSLQQGIKLLLDIKEPSPDVKVILDELAEWEYSYYAERSAPPRPFSSEDLFHIDQSELTDWLRGAFSTEGNIGLDNISLVDLRGDLITFELTLKGTPLGSDSLLLKASSSNDECQSAYEKLKDEFEVLHSAYKAGVQVPEPLAFEDNCEILGSPFFISRKIKGTSAGRNQLNDGAKIQQLLKDIVGQLYLIHTNDLGRAGSQDSSLTVSEAASHCIDKLYSDWSALDVPSPLLAQAFYWLKSNRVEDTESASWVHGHFQISNVMVNNGNYSGIVDWGVSHVNDPLTDVVRLIDSLEDVVPAEELINCYQDFSGTSVSAPRLNYCRVLNATSDLVRGYSAMKSLSTNSSANEAYSEACELLLHDSAQRLVKAMQHPV